MANRLTRIYTRTGDAGETGLGDGSRTSKASARIEALGAIDELNSHIGMILTETLPDDVRARLVRVQHELFDLGGEISVPGHRLLHGDEVQALEDWLDEYNAALSPLKEFILPGGARAATHTHVARTVCRRAERALVRLGQDALLAETSLRYLNRLSDFLFVLARVLNGGAGVPDVLWLRREHRT